MFMIINNAIFLFLFGLSIKLHIINSTKLIVLHLMNLYPSQNCSKFAKYLIKKLNKLINVLKYNLTFLRGSITPGCILFKSYII